MNVLDLCCSIGGWSIPWFQNGHSVTGIDIEDFSKVFPGNFIKADIMDWEPKEKYDIILASPPCTEFSIAKKFGHGNQVERHGLDLVFRVFSIIQQVKPKYYVIENVKGLAEFLGPPNEIIQYSHKKNAKAAYLWGNFKKLGFFDMAINHIPEDILLKKHNFKTKSMLISKIPLALSNEMYKAMTQ